MQRVFDIFFSSLALALLSPLFLLVVIILKFSGEGEVLFFQKRVGKDLVSFELFKFVTMIKDSPNIGTGTLTIKDDPRILPFGRFLRKSKVNELPQLLNVFLGQMSVIGPRPLTQDSFSSYSKEVQKLISMVRPGLSGIGSIIFRDEENILTKKEDSQDFYSKIISPYKGKLESWYVKNYGIKTYFKAIIMTVWAIIFPSSGSVWSLFKDLPEPPNELKSILNWKL